MDAQELRNLQEAYMEVVMGEGYKSPKPVRLMRKMGELRGNTEFLRNKSKESFRTPEQRKSMEKAADKLEKRGDKMDRAWTKHDPEKVKKKERQNKSTITVSASSPSRGQLKSANEQADIYDIILSHLLDEGYAETPEAAEAIMVNMSEEWRDSIIG
jgi:hypothetical protein